MGKPVYCIAGRDWTLTRGVWVSGPLVVCIRDDRRSGEREWSPSRAPLELYPTLTAACAREIELHERAVRRARTQVESEDAAERLARSARSKLLWWCAGLAVVWILLGAVCAGVWSWL